MKLSVEKQLSEARSALRQFPSSYATPKTTSDRQKLLVSITQEYVRHLNDCIRGEYRDRMMVRHAELRMYTLALKKFEDFQLTVSERSVAALLVTVRAQINDTVPKFKQEGFVAELAVQIEQLRGREFPGFMSSQAFYMCMSQYVDQWIDPMHKLIQDVRGVAVEVCNALSEILLIQYPGLRESLQLVIEKILSDITDETAAKLSEVVAREKDPFTLNDFLQQWVNKLRFDRFSHAVDQVFDSAKNPGSNWNALKEEVFIGMRHWYRSTHSVSAIASAQDMSAILEAYWNLSAKRFVDQCCMIADKDVLGRLSGAIQDQMYQYIRDDLKLEDFFAENPEILAQRQELESRREQLTQAASKLASITVTPIISTAPPPKPAPTAAAPPATQKKDAHPPVFVVEVKMTAHGIGMALTSENVMNVALNGHAGMAVFIKDLRKLPVGNPAQEAGLRVGDRIVAINDVAVNDPTEAVNLIKQAKGGSVKIAATRHS